MDWNQLEDEATKYLQNYIRINTVNPPGNEVEGARFFKKIFEAESIPCQLYEPSPGRGNILATLKGTGAKRPVLLLSHIDVVPAEKAGWEVDPFGGEIKDGYLYGRGALDNKSMGIVEMMVLLAFKREKVSFKRDLLFLATAEEETGGKWGVQWLMENVPSLREVEYALNEGGYVTLNEKGFPDRYEISSGQKVVFQLKLRARGTTGHASMPHGDNPNVKLVKALHDLVTWETPYEVLPMVKEFFQKMAPRQEPERQRFFEDVEKGLRDPSFSRWIGSNPIYNAMVRNTISLTVLQAGSKSNVIPSESTAVLDCRLIPGSSKEHFRKEVQRRLGGEIEIEVESQNGSIPPSPLDTDLFRAIQRFVVQNDPNVPVLPLLLPGATDSRYLRNHGITAYDFCPFRLKEKEMMRIHGHNERIALENLTFGMRMLAEILREVAT